MVVIDELRKPFLVVALVLAVVCLAVESGSKLWQPAHAGVSTTDLSRGVTDPETVQLLAANHSAVLPRPGLGISSLLCLDAITLLTLLLFVGPLVIPAEVLGRVQGIVTLVLSIVLLILTFLLLLKTIAEVLLMVALLVAVPFGTIAYLVKWGVFDTSAAAVTLGLLLACKLGLGASLLIANQRFAKHKALMLFLLTTIAATLLLQFLQGLVPGILVSITDGIGAIIILVLALIWLIPLLVGSIISIIRVVA